jgi:hypothetical protein
MKGIGKYWLFVALVALAGLLVVTPLAAQSTPNNTGGSGPNLNRLAPPCDFSDQFYADNGIDVTGLIGRFGDSRQFGPPSRSFNQPNWVTDHANCSAVDPDRRDIRILATTGGNADDGVSPFTCASTDPNSMPHAPGCANISAIEPESFEFIAILAFLDNQTTFSQSYLRTVGFINGGLEGVQQNPGVDISIGQTLNEGGQTIVEAPGNTLRSFAMQDIVSNFEAYANIDQFKRSLTCPASAVAPFTSANCTRTPTQFATNPCSLGMIQNLQNPAATSIPQPCFQVADDNNGSDVATPNLTQDWRFATNRNAMDGSDGNDPVGALTGGVNNKPFGYFCDDLLGMWIITYFWMTEAPATADTTCAPIFSGISAANGTANDGGPIILTAFELNSELEANNCGAEGQEDPGGGDGGAAWLICPALPDPRAGAITSDAFLDQQFTSRGAPQNVALTINFLSLQIFGVFANELSSKQLAQVTAAATP